jgi:amino acid adenylation domain-containing protein
MQDSAADRKTKLSPGKQALLEQRLRGVASDESRAKESPGITAEPNRQVKVNGLTIDLGEIETTLGQHAGVRECVVIAREDEASDSRLVAYVVPESADQDSRQQENPKLESEQVSQWQTIWEETYKPSFEQRDPTFNISGWNSSYTGAPYPAEEMRELVDDTVQRILSLRPSRVLEVGCGTGLLLFRIAPFCEEYLGTDFSESALRGIQEQLRAPGRGLPQVSLSQQMGDDFEGIEPAALDTVILNSVAQNFPSLNYLLRFLEGAIKAVRPGGKIFVGDVRNFALLEAFHASVQFYRAPSSLTKAELRERINKHLFQEDQLLIDPRFFNALRQHFPQITAVEIKLKRGYNRNEMTRFRYDAILHVGANGASSVDSEWLDWQKQQLTLKSLRQFLIENKPETLVITHVPNARLQEEIRLLELLQDDAERTVGELRDVLSEMTNDAGVEPEESWALSEQSPYSVDVTWLSSGANGCFDVVLTRQTDVRKKPALISEQARVTVNQRLSYYANNPLQWKTSNSLVPQLRGWLKRKLPEYMIPSAFVVLDEFPLTPDGNVHRAALVSLYQSGPELQMQFADAAVWQADSPQTEVHQKHLAYWKEQLRGAPTLLDLPTDRPRQAAQTYKGAHQSIMLSQELSDELRTLSQGEGVTLFMTLLAVFYTLLYRYTSQDDILVGSPHANHADTDGPEFFMNNLVLRTDLSDDPSFRELLARVRQVTLSTFTHQDLPFEKLVEELRPDRSLGHTPLFQVMLALQNAVTQALEITEPKPSELQSDDWTSKVDLKLFVIEEAEGLRGRLEYNADLFDAATIQRMLGHFRTLLESVVRNPAQRISTLSLLTEAERQQVLVEWNDTQTDFPKDSCLHQLFERQVEQRPNDSAVLFKNGQLTYGELNQRANQLAHYLGELGVGPDVPVGICVERSVEMVVGILGILKAGGAYVPLDPSYPGERLSFMLKDTKTSVLVTQQRLLAKLPEHVARVVCLDADWKTIAGGATENPAVAVMPDNLAYVIYTSGSTGIPKGIAIRHRGVVNNIVDLNRRFSVGPEDRVLALSSLSFDMCVYEVLGTLESGGAIVLPDAAARRDPAHWAELVVQHKVTVWNSAPSLLEMFVEHVHDRPQLKPGSLRLALLGGDWVPVSLPDQLRSLVEGVEVIVMGGATEASIHSIIYEVKECDPSWRSIPYGRPMANQRAYILDSHSQLAPIGVPGELHLGGVGLAWGYFNRPDLTAEKFVPNPFCPEAGDRLYKTGDLARWMADENIELLGRMDFQVKIRGHRIELGEISVLLRNYPGVEEAVAVVREDEPRKKRLVAYVVLADDSAPSISELRNFLTKTLPEYMVPSAFIILDALPLSPNGKVDRRALPAPERTRPELEEAYEAPRSPVEEVVARIWAEVLGVDEVGVHDNFFALGGHSLQATQVISRLQDVFELELPLRHLFESPTVAGLAKKMETFDGSAQKDIVKIARVLIRLNELSEEEAKTMLVQRSKL